METSSNLWENTERPSGDSVTSPERKRAMLLPYTRRRDDRLAEDRPEQGNAFAADGHRPSLE